MLMIPDIKEVNYSNSGSKNWKHVKGGIALCREPAIELRSIPCHMASHIVSCHSTQVNAPHLNLSQTGRYSIYLPQRDGRLS